MVKLPMMSDKMVKKMKRTFMSLRLVTFLKHLKMFLIRLMLPSNINGENASIRLSSRGWVFFMV